MSNITNINTIKYFGSENSTKTKHTDTAGLTTIVTPASNTKGIVIYHINCFTTGGGSGDAVSVMFETSAPTLYRSGHILAMSIYNINEGYANETAMPIFIPAGNGLYVLTSGAYGTGNTTIIYEVL